MKWILRTLGLLLALVLAVLIYVYLNLGSLIKQGIETYAPPLLGVNVEVASVSLIPISGAGSISGFIIANPKGYGDGNAIGLGDFQIKLDIASLSSDVIIIENILIDTPELNFIQHDDGSSNFQQLLENINLNSGEGSATNSSNDSSESSETNTKLIVDSFGLHNVVITATSPLLPNQSIKVPIPDINLSGLGRNTNGAYPEDIAKEVAEKLLAEAKKALLNSDIYKEQVKKALEEKLEAEKARLKARANAKRQELEQKLNEKLGDKKDLLKGFFK